MEPHSRTPARAHGLRPLSLPQPVMVRADERGWPVEVTRMSRTQRTLAVASVEEAWKIAEEWWRDEPLDRTYYRVLLADGRSLTLFHEGGSRPGDGWYEQRY